MKISNHTTVILSTVLLMAFTWACQSRKNNEADVAASQASSYPALGSEEVKQLYNTADHVDIIFFHHPISVNQDDAASVRNTVLYISPASPNITGKCNPIARLSWMAQGTILREADVYVDAGCQYLLFIEHTKPVAANALALPGVDFFNNVIRQVEQYQK